MKNRTIGALFLTGLVIMLGLIVRVFVFWFHHDSLTSMQLIKTIPHTYLALFVDWVLLILLQLLYKYRKTR